MKTEITAVFVLIFMNIFFLVMKLSDYFNAPRINSCSLDFTMVM